MQNLGIYYHLNVKDAGFHLNVWFNSDITKEESILNGACSITG